MSSQRSDRSEGASDPVAVFYAHTGQALAEDVNYPHAIRHHLSQERAIMVRRLSSGAYFVVAEVGCMDGRLLLSDVLRFPARYVGIDLVAASIQVLNQRLRDVGIPEARAVGVALDARRLSELDQLRGIGNTLVVFPFNSFGNLSEPVIVLAEAALLSAEVLIFTYRTDEMSTRLRAEYYANCGMANLMSQSTEDGVIFTSSDGLATCAYSRRWYESKFRAHGYTCTFEEFGQLGFAVHAAPSSHSR